MYTYMHVIGLIQNRERSTSLRFRSTIALIFLIASSSSAIAESLIRQVFVSDRPDEQLESLLYLSAGVGLADLGWSSTMEVKRADLVLTIAYEAASPEVDLRLSLARADAPGRALASDEARLRLDLSLDAGLSAALRSLLEAADLKNTGEGSSKAEVGGLFTSELVPLESTLRTDKAVRIETLAYGGGISFIGDFAEYARFGATACLEAGVLFIKRNWSLSAGLRLAETRALNNDGVEGPALYASRIGLHLRYGVGAAQAQRLAGSLSAGTAFLTVDSDGGDLTKTVPYADAGIHAGFPLGKDFFIGAEVRFLAIFDPDVLIMGAEPAISICKEF
jgi:hypothetical protein